MKVAFQFSAEHILPYIFDIYVILTALKANRSSIVFKLMIAKYQHQVNYKQGDSKH